MADFNHPPEDAPKGRARLRRPPDRQRLDAEVQRHLHEDLDDPEIDEKGGPNASMSRLIAVIALAILGLITAAWMFLH